MRKRRLLLLVVILGSIPAILLMVGSQPQGPGVTKANFDRIEKGMSRAEVEKIFGGPPEPLVGYLTSSSWAGSGWRKNNWEIAVIVFDPWQHAVVTDKEWMDFNPSLFQKLRWWFAPRLPW